MAAIDPVSPENYLLENEKFDSITVLLNVLERLG
jgi:hypothetical protein